MEFPSRVFPEKLTHFSTYFRDPFGPDISSSNHEFSGDVLAFRGGRMIGDPKKNETPNDEFLQLF